LNRYLNEQVCGDPEMKCVCCLSGRVITSPAGLRGYYCCNDCGLIFAGTESGQNTRDNLTSHYQNIDPHRKVASSKEFFFNSVLGYLSSRIRKERRSILDVGCGYGYFLELARSEGWEASGVEIVNAVDRDAPQKAIDQNIFYGTLKEAEYPNNHFDAVTLWDVLVFVHNPFEEAKECYRVLKKGGIIGIRVRNIIFEKTARRAYFLLRKIYPHLNLKNPSVFHRYCFTSKSLFQLLLRAGFTNIIVTNSPLTKGDPYDYGCRKGLTKAAKSLMDYLSRIVFWFSAGRMVVGPSLLIWAEKS
jgi:SAM-dependent methyltransferase